ncbi:hypothetical protein ABG768_010866, partial [Culter alburnus]
AQAERSGLTAAVPAHPIPSFSALNALFHRDRWPESSKQIRTTLFTHTQAVPPQQTPTPPPHPPPAAAPLPPPFPRDTGAAVIEQNATHTLSSPA